MRFFGGTGDAVKLWLAENCIFDPKAFETTQVLYSEFRFWCAENGLFPVSRPKLRDTIMGFRSGIVSTKRRVYDAGSEDIKPLWGLVGIRLRRPDDPHEDLDVPCSNVPEVFHEKANQESSADAICSGVPSESENSGTIKTVRINSEEMNVEKDQSQERNTGTLPDSVPEISVSIDGTQYDARQPIRSPISGDDGSSLTVDPPDTRFPTAMERLCRGVKRSTLSCL
jgi:hypothetical protein